MSLELFLETYGYAALLLGTFLEGEAVLIMGGFLAHRGYLHLTGVIAAAFLGTLINGQRFYVLGRHKGAVLLERYQSRTQRIDRLRGMLHRHQTAVLLGFRFLYGLRTATPLLLGTSGIPFRQYTVLNVIGAAVWAVIVGILGYAMGLTLEGLLSEVEQYEAYVLGVIAAVAARLPGEPESRARDPAPAREAGPPALPPVRAAGPDPGGAARPAIRAEQEKRVMLTWPF